MPNVHLIHASSPSPTSATLRKWNTDAGDTDEDPRSDDSPLHVASSDDDAGQHTIVGTKGRVGGVDKNCSHRRQPVEAPLGQLRRRRVGLAPFVPDGEDVSPGRKQNRGIGESQLQGDRGMCRGEAIEATDSVGEALSHNAQGPVALLALSADSTCDGQDALVVGSRIDRQLPGDGAVEDVDGLGVDHFSRAGEGADISKRIGPVRRVLDAVTVLCFGIGGEQETHLQQQRCNASGSRRRHHVDRRGDATDWDCCGQEEKRS
jgi:hypothetical protein